MDQRALLRGVAAAQGAYYLATGLWPLVHMPSFLGVTGPKTDLWLVRTVGVLVAAVGAGLLLAAAQRRVDAPVALVAVGSAAGLGAVDVVYATRDVIRDVYLLDAAAEAALVAAWGGAWLLARGGRREGADAGARGTTRKA